MTVSHGEFKAALLDARMPAPGDLQDPGGAPAGARFSVYRNNVVVSLSEALMTAFPLVKSLLGQQLFQQLAEVFVRAHPPTSPLMMFYGEALPAFLDGFEPLQHLGYLPDCARLDLALRQSYHAADAPPFDATVLQQAPEQVSKLRVALHPATRIIRSHWPLHDLWRFNMEPGSPKPRAVAQDVMITRLDFDPHPQALPPGAADWLALLECGLPLGAATEQTLENHQDFDLTKALTLALSCQALVNYPPKDT